MASLKINRGTTYTISVNYSRNGEPASLVGATVRFTAKPNEWDDDAVDNSASVRKDITNGTEEGAATIILNPADTSNLEPGTYFYDIKVEEASGAIYKIDEGKIKLDGSPTNRT